MPNIDLYLYKIGRLDCSICHGSGAVESLGGRRVFCECCREQAILVEHLQPKAGDMLVFKIPVGNLPQSEIKGYMGEIAERITRELPERSGVDVIFCPIRDDKSPQVALCPDNTWRQWALA